MGKGGETFWNMAMYRRAVSRWAFATRDASEADLHTIKRQRTRAKSLQAHLNEFIRVADKRLAEPTGGGSSVPKAHNADWAWRPDVWCEALAEKGISAVQNRYTIGNDTTLFHDCSRSETNVRQISNIHSADSAAYGMRIEVFGFSGSFLSLVFDLPHGAVEGLKRSHILEINSLIEMERPVELFARLNIRHGPNTEQIVREMPLDSDTTKAEFDLAYIDLKEKRIEKVWVDLIFENPEMNQITLRDLTFSRRPRAQV